MPLFHIVFLAIVQGITEFLPVSSSAHLILGGKLMRWEDQGLIFDLAVHVGTLLAVLLYFRNDLWAMLESCVRPSDGEASRRNRFMVLCLAVASAPVLLVGALGHELVEVWLRDLRVIGVTTIVFGLVMWWADRIGAKSKTMTDMDVKSAFKIGLWQTLALVPGVSRSGVTLTAGRFLGFDADASARFSFLLSIPVIGGAGAFAFMTVAEGRAPINWADFGLGVFFAALAGWACIAVFLRLLKAIGLVPFVIYRLALGVVLLWVAF